MREIRDALAAACIDHQAYFGHSFHIGTATMVAQAGLPTHMIKMLGQCTSDAYLYMYQLYVHTPRETLVVVAQTITL